MIKQKPEEANIDEIIPFLEGMLRYAEGETIEEHE